MPAPMTIRYSTTEQTDAKFIRMLAALIAFRRGETYDAINATIYLREQYGIDVDWHITQYALETLERMQKATQVTFGGFCRYHVND